MYLSTGDSIRCCTDRRVPQRLSPRRLLCSTQASSLLVFSSWRYWQSQPQTQPVVAIARDARMHAWTHIQAEDSPGLKQTRRWRCKDISSTGRSRKGSRVSGRRSRFLSEGRQENNYSDSDCRRRNLGPPTNRVLVFIKRNFVSHYLYP